MKLNVLLKREGYWQEIACYITLSRLNMIDDLFLAIDTRLWQSRCALKRDRLFGDELGSRDGALS